MRKAHHASGGSARVRVGGETVSFNAVSVGHFHVPEATQYRLQFQVCTMDGLVLCVGYSTGLTFLNAAWHLASGGTFTDNVPKGTTVYLLTVESDAYIPQPGGANDRARVSFYD